MSWFSGKRVYITGGSSGIGKSTAQELIKRGAHVFISARGKERLEAALEELRKGAGPEQIVAGRPLDVSNEDEVRAAAPEILQALGGLDILINNAGVAYVCEPEQATTAEYRRMMDINYFGTVYTTLAFLPHFRQQRSGSIAAVSSTLGMMGLYGYTAYAASKYAITGFSDCLRQDLLRYNVQVSVLFPADTDTPQYHEENQTKPAETKALAGTASLVSAEYVAEAFCDGLAAGRYLIVPGASNKFVIWAHHKMPWLVRWVIDRDLRKFWRKGQPASVANATTSS